MPLTSYGYDAAFIEPAPDLLRLDHPIIGCFQLDAWCLRGDPEHIQDQGKATYAAKSGIESIRRRRSHGECFRCLAGGSILLQAGHRQKPMIEMRGGCQFCAGRILEIRSLLPMPNNAEPFRVNRVTQGKVVVNYPFIRSFYVRSHRIHPQRNAGQDQCPAGQP